MPTVRGLIGDRTNSLELENRQLRAKVAELEARLTTRGRELAGTEERLAAVERVSRETLDTVAELEGLVDERLDQLEQLANAVVMIAAAGHLGETRELVAYLKVARDLRAGPKSIDGLIARAEARLGVKR